MIISQQRRKFEDGKIWMPDWMRAPLYLQPGASCWLAHRDAKGSHSNTIYEVALSCIDQRHWPYLWKLKLTTTDEPGIAGRLTTLLQDADIEILTAESSVHSHNKYNSMSFILSVENYKHKLDGDFEAHGHITTRRLEYLELLLLSAIGGQLVFHRNGRARFELHPMRFYAQRTERHSITQPLPRDDLENGEFALPPIVCKAIRQRCGADNVYYAGAVDTENRVIRILFFPGAGDKAVMHLQFSAAELNATAVRGILRNLPETINILRFQIRRGLNNNDETEALQLAEKIRNDDVGAGPGRLDLTFESIAENLTAPALMAEIKAAIGNDPALAEYNVHVTCEEPKISG